MEYLDGETLEAPLARTLPLDQGPQCRIRVGVRRVSPHPCSALSGSPGA
jgi:hypothetical protein